ncbi:MAG: hypothetical protein ACK4NF_05225 [Planctomycetota bacterium]
MFHFRKQVTKTTHFYLLFEGTDFAIYSRRENEKNFKENKNE